MARGQFISLEGGEGAGKSTQSQLLCRRLESYGIETLATREPGGSPGAEEIRVLLVSGKTERWDPLTEALLHNAARHDHVQRTILPALRRGVWVITDLLSRFDVGLSGLWSRRRVGRTKPDRKFGGRRGDAGPHAHLGSAGR